LSGATGFEVGSGVFSVNATPEVSQALRQLDTDGYVFAVGGEWGVSRLSSAHFLHIYTDTIAIMLPTPDFSTHRFGTVFVSGRNKINLTSFLSLLFSRRYAVQCHHNDEYHMGSVLWFDCERIAPAL
jgi:hypothetical protein